MDTSNLSPEAREAAHAAKNAQQKIELAREAQLTEIATRTAELTEQALLKGLQKVFGMDGGDRSDQEMKILVQRVPILCTMLVAMDKRIEKIDANLTWGVRIIVGAVLAAVLALVLK